MNWEHADTYSRVFAVLHLGTFALQNLRGFPGLAFTWYNVIVSCERDQIKMSGYMDRRVTPPERVTQLSPIPTSM